MDQQEIIDWLMTGDISIRYQTERDLQGSDRLELQRRIAGEGWGKRFLALRRQDGHWGRGFYQPKWTSTHYTVLDLKNLALPPDHPLLRETVSIILKEQKAADGGINPAKTIPQSDVCINGMFLDYACYFRIPEDGLESVVDFVIREHMPDGGFNCESNRWSPVHSSLHTSLSILEGIHAYEAGGYSYRVVELKKIAAQAREFILQHRLFRSDRTGRVIDPKFLLLSFPSRWRYDILRALDYFRSAGTPYDPRMQDALDVLLKKRGKDGRWPLQGRHPGQVHFEMESIREPSRWNTLRALRVLQHFGMLPANLPV